VWFVVALPVYLSSVFGWDVAGGGFLAAWVFGIVQSSSRYYRQGQRPVARFARSSLGCGVGWFASGVALGLNGDLSAQVLIGGLMLFGACLR
jgi:uncharacterized membrane protein YfcA